MIGIFTNIFYHFIFDFSSCLILRTFFYNNCRNSRGLIVKGQTREFARCTMLHRGRADKLTFFYCTKQNDVCFECVSPVIDTEFRHDIVNIFRRSTRLVDPQLL